MKFLANLSLEESIKNLDDVLTLQINFNPSSYIFDGIGENFKNLQRLYIIDEGIGFVDRSNFLNMRHLKELSIHHNPLKIIAEDVFWDLLSLEHLNIHSCQLKKLSNRLFENLPHLKGVDLSRNQLTSVVKELFQNNPKLEEIFLAQNNLKIVDVDFSKLVKLNAIDMSDSGCVTDKWFSKVEGWYTNYTSTVGTIQELQATVIENCKK